MKTQITLALILALAAAPYAAAGNSPIEELAAASGLTTRQVQMVIGTRTAYAEYRTSYYRVRAQFIRAVGQQQYDALVQLHRDGKNLTKDAAITG